MRRVALLLLLALCGSLAHGETYTLGPESQPQAGVPKGTVTESTLPPGRFYPGTPHTYWVYVPAQYDATKPTPFMIFLDGSQALGNAVRVPVVLDNLIAKHELPPMIGIFVNPGVLPTARPNAQNRYNRIFEYDSISSRFSSFLIDELIPAVGAKYHLSKNPDDRGLSGVSTGAVGAFMAAWNRPDQFHRVLSFIGTYVAMKGADQMPALIRKTEPKPIRVFMQDGTNDHIVPAEPWGTFYAGSWPINNQVMYQALEYSGYDVKLVMGTEAHNMKQGGAIMPDALRWLWRGYPAPVVVHEPAAMNEPGWDPRAKVYSAVYVDKPWQQVKGDYRDAASPAPDKDGAVYFVDAAEKQIDKAAPDGTVTVFRRGVSGVTALRAGADGRIYAAEPEMKRIVSWGVDGGEKVVARDVEAHDIAVTQQGAVYFTDPAHRTVGVVDGAGHVRVVVPAGLIALPAGVALSPDQAMVIVTDGQSRYSWSFEIAPDGGLQDGEPFYRLEMPEESWMSHTGGAWEDTDGMVYFATPMGLQVCEANGRMAEVLNAPEPGSAVTGLAFAGGRQERLYVTESGRLYQRPVKVTGAQVWSPVKPPTPRL